MQADRPNSRCDPMLDAASIRFDEDYQQFFNHMSGQGRKLPPPVDNRTLYQELPGLLQHKINAHGQLLGPHGGVMRGIQIATCKHRSAWGSRRR
jgi:hypothetical protein